MHKCTSVRGVPIRLTAERWMHIIEARDELAGRLPDVLDVPCLQAEEEKSHMALGQLRGKDVSSILRAVPALVGMPQKSMWTDYDSEADVLYIAFERPQRATDSELRDDGIIVHRRGKRIVGVTILDASER